MLFPGREKPLADKHPHHDSALRIPDMHPGVRFVEVNHYAGALDEYVVLSRPYVRSISTLTKTHRMLAITVRHCSSGRTEVKYLDDLGIIPCRANLWGPYYAIPTAKRHLLPAQRPRRPRLPNTYLTWY